jgi:hypothetical protein
VACLKTFSNDSTNEAKQVQEDALSGQWNAFRTGYGFTAMV